MNISLNQAFKITLAYFTRVIILSLPMLIIMSTIKKTPIEISPDNLLFIKLVFSIATLPICLLAFKKVIMIENFKGYFKEILGANSKQIRFYLCWIIIAEIAVAIMHGFCSSFYGHLIGSQFYLCIHIGYSILATCFVLQYLINDKPRFIFGS